MFLASGLSRLILKKIWDFSDIDRDGSLDVYEFSVAKHLIGQVQESTNALPSKLDENLVPPNKRNLNRN